MFRACFYPLIDNARRIGILSDSDIGKIYTLRDSIGRSVYFINIKIDFNTFVHYMTSLHQRIIQARKDSGHTQKDAARLLNVDVMTLNRYEKGHRQPGVGFIVDLLKLTGCSAEWLLIGENRREVVTSKELKSLSKEITRLIEKIGS